MYLKNLVCEVITGASGRTQSDILQGVYILLYLLEGGLDIEEAPALRGMLHSNFVKI